LSCSAIVVAAGRGERLRSASGAVSKNFLEIDTPIGRVPIVVAACNRLIESKLFSELIVVISKSEEDLFRRAFDQVSELFNLVPRFVYGGETRQASVYEGLKSVSLEATHVAIHDAARPIVSLAALSAVVEAAIDSSAALLVESVFSTLKQVTPEGVILKTLPRENFALAQTPQVFKKDLILRAHEKALAEGLQATDDAQLVELLGEKVKAVFNDTPNPKLTTPQDLLFLPKFTQ